MDDEEYFDAETMLRLKQKGKLIKDTSHVFEELAKKAQVYRELGWRGNRFLSGAVKSIHKDFKLGLNNINKKIPVFVELPTVKSVNENGMVSKTFDGQSAPASFEVHDLQKQKVEPVKSTEMIDYTDET